MKYKIAIIHYQPLEYYPPVVNFLDYLSNYLDNVLVNVYSSQNLKGRKRYLNKRLSIKRYPLPDNKERSLKRLFKYYYFNFKVLFNLIKTRPQSILYYETYSAMPVYWYMRYFDPKVKLFIHSHEYFYPDWYKKGMRLLKVYHQKELDYLYNKAIWISQTNKYRCELFQRDTGVDEAKIKILPNYPPQKWFGKEQRQDVKMPIRFIYIGSLSLEGTYISEFINWVKSKNGKVKFDIYSYNYDALTENFILNNLNEDIRFFSQGVDYEDIPHLLDNYSIGVILYKGVEDNFRFNATNKLFEYLSRNLDVWFPMEMIGCYDYIEMNHLPKVLKIDFSELDRLDWEKAIDHTGLEFKKNDFFCESAFAPLVNKLVKPSLSE